jgi:Na+-translocating ferredoxin:NAD+ oxidoreductase RnfC subunit
MRESGVKFVQQKPVEVHPMKDARRVPLSMLRRRLKVEQYETDTPFDPSEYKPNRVRLRLKQHAGKPATATVNKGQSVKVGDLIAAAQDGVSANVHASIAGTVRSVNDTMVELEA